MAMNSEIYIQDSVNTNSTSDGGTKRRIIPVKGEPDGQLRVTEVGVSGTVSTFEKDAPVTSIVTVGDGSQTISGVTIRQISIKFLDDNTGTPANNSFILVAFNASSDANADTLLGAAATRRVVGNSAIPTVITFAPGSEASRVDFVADNGTATATKVAIEYIQ